MSLPRTLVDMVAAMANLRPDQRDALIADIAEDDDGGFRRTAM